MELAATDEDADPLGDRALQPRRRKFQPNGSHDGDFIDALAKKEATAEARRLQRLADREIVLTLELQGFDTSTPEWRLFAEALIEYAYSVLVGWLVTGVIYQMAAAQRNGKGVHGLNKVPDDLRLHGDEPHALATEVVIVAIRKFRVKTLMNKDPSKRWRVDGGASIKTFFIGRCLMELPDAFEKWDRTERRTRLEVDPYDKLIGKNATDRVNLEAPALASAELDRVFDGIDPLIRVMFELHQEGYTYEEIAEMLTGGGHSTTIGQVRTKMSRARNIMKTRT